MKISLLTTILLIVIQLSWSQKVKELKPRKFQDGIKHSASGVIIDVRSAQSYSKAHIDNSINIDFKSDSFDSEILKMDTSKTYFVYCTGGVTSVTAIKMMQKKGFTDLYSLKGGIMRWKAKGLPLEEGE